jgi:hypothetical protein
VIFEKLLLGFWRIFPSFQHLSGRVCAPVFPGLAASAASGRSQSIVNFIDTCGKRAHHLL